MNHLDVPAINTDKATIDVLEPVDGCLRARFSGTIDQLQPGEFLDPLFVRLDTLAAEQGLATVEVDLTELSFLNSSGIKSLANWVKRHMALAPEARPVLRLVYTEQVTWQRATIKALMAMARGAIEVEAR